LPGFAILASKLNSMLHPYTALGSKFFSLLGNPTPDNLKAVSVLATISASDRPTGGRWRYPLNVEITR
jgi:hypothetical protein